MWSCRPKCSAAGERTAQHSRRSSQQASRLTDASVVVPTVDACCRADDGCMNSPVSGDVLVTQYADRDHHYIVLDAMTGHTLAGPFARLEFAIGVAHSFAWRHAGARIWGRKKASSEMKLLCSVAHDVADFFAEMTGEFPRSSSTTPGAEGASGDA